MTSKWEVIKKMWWSWARPKNGDACRLMAMEENFDKLLIRLGRNDQLFDELVTLTGHAYEYSIKYGEVILVKKRKKKSEKSKSK